MTNIIETVREPKACPFCGEAELLDMPVNDIGYEPSGDVACFGCGASGPIRDAAGQRADAVERWNTRALTDSTFMVDEATVPVQKISDADRERFEGKTVKSEGGCWFWTGAKNEQGYGSFWIGGKMVSAHRVAVAMAGRPVGAHNHVLHLCDTRCCVNPLHLTVAASAKNAIRSRADHLAEVVGIEDQQDSPGVPTPSASGNPLSSADADRALRASPLTRFNRAQEPKTSKGQAMLYKPERQYFRVTEGPCWDILVDWRAKRQAIEAECFDFAKASGGTGFYGGHDDNVGNATAVSAVTFAGELPKGWKPRNWKSLVAKEGETPAWPDQRTIAGKAALAAIRALPLRPSTYHVCKAIGFPSSLEYSGKSVTKGYDGMGVFDIAVIGWLQETFYIALPKLSEARQRLIDSGYTVATPDWTPLAGMEPILKEEMELDYARARLAKAA